MKLVTVVGARPQFVKAATFSRALAKHNASGRSPIEERIVHTGQHYDANMSAVFFEELGIPAPAYNLGIGSGPHGRQTGRMLEEIERVLLLEDPDLVLVYGDTNSTLAGALAAAKLHVRLAHIESGLRSHNRRMPEEINRVIVDHLSALLFCPTRQAVENLEREGIRDGVHAVGDIMFDSMLHYSALVKSRPSALEALGLASKNYALATVHRAENTDTSENLFGIFQAFGQIQKDLQIVVALHPRTRQLLAAHGIDVPAGVRLLEPLPYLDMVELEIHARLILTDSGGVQKEAFFAGTPCISLREETEWVETTIHDANVLCGASTSRIVDGFRNFIEGRLRPTFDATSYGNGQAAEKIVELLQT
jgi:UDP-GlcNAc3NAcA epimerase